MNPLDKLKKVKLFRLKSNGGRFHWKQILTIVYELGLCSILVEGGSQVFTSAIKQKAVDKFYFFVSPIIIGNGNSIPLVTLNSPKNIKDAFRLKNTGLKRIGDNILISGYPS